MMMTKKLESKKNSIILVERHEHLALKTFFNLFTNLTDFFFSETLVQTVEPAFSQSLSLPLLARALPTSQLDQEIIQQTCKFCFAFPIMKKYRAFTNISELNTDRGQKSVTLTFSSKSEVVAFETLSSSSSTFPLFSAIQAPPC